MLQNRDRLVHDVVHVGPGLRRLLLGDDFFHPTRVEVNEVADAAAIVGEVFDGEAEPAWTGRPDHQPGAAARKMFVRDFGGELLVIGFIVVPADTLLGHAGRAASFENIEGAALVFFWHPNLGLQIAKPFVLEMGEAQEIMEPLNLTGRIPARFLRPIEPEWTPRVW